MNQSDVIDQLTDLVNSEHCAGCDQNTCDITVAHRLGYGLWAVELFAGSGATSPKFDALYRQVGPMFRRRAAAERKLLCNEPHVSCDQCNAVIWVPEECDYYCDSCGKQAAREVQP